MTRFSKILTSLALAMVLVFSFTSCGSSSTKGDLTLQLRCESTLSNGSIGYIPCLDVSGTDSARVFLYDEGGYSLYPNGVTIFFEEGTSDVLFTNLEEGRYSYKVYIYGHDGSVMYQNEGEAGGSIYYLDVYADENNVYEIKSYYNEPAPTPTTGSLTFHLTNLTNSLFFGADNGYIFWAVYNSNNTNVCSGKKIVGQLSPRQTISCGELPAGAYSYEIYVTDSYSSATDAASAWADTTHLKAYNSALTPEYFVDVVAGEDNDYDVVLGLYP